MMFHEMYLAGDPATLFAEAWAVMVWIGVGEGKSRPLPDLDACPPHHGPLHLRRGAGVRRLACDDFSADSAAARSDVGHSKTLTAEDAEDAEEGQNEGKQNWNKNGVIDHEPPSAQFIVRDHSPLNAFNSCPFPLVHFLRVLCVLCDRRLN